MNRISLTGLLLPLLLLPAARGGAGVTATEQAPDFLSRVSSDDEFAAISRQSQLPFAVRVTKFLVPARDDPSLLEPVFQNVNRYAFHFEFLASVFPDRFPGLTMAEYLGLVERRDTRDYYAGTITHYEGPTPGTTYGFTVFTDGSRPDELLEPDEVLSVYQSLRQDFALSGLKYAPQSAAAILKAQGWADPGFPIRLVGDQSFPDVIGYSPATNYGRLELFALEDIQSGEALGELDWQTIAVIDGAPPDMETVVAGVVTAAPQGELSHLAVRLARRGVPNAFVRNASAVFQEFEGDLVRLEVFPDRYSLRRATLDEAEAWWSQHRPSLPPIPAIDESYGELDELTSMDIDGPGAAPLARFGGKAAGLAILYRYLPGEFQTRGFAVPFRHYLEFVRTNTMPSLDDPQVEVSYEQYMEQLLADPLFRSDGEYRRDALRSFRDHAKEHGVVAEELVDRIRNRILQVFQDPQVKVRFRSSSNAEDSPEFPGAGLYDSTSVCLPDELDGNDEGPSLCDSSKKKERTIVRGLKRVWMSLWNHRAFDEREYFQIDHRRAGMAVLVTLAYPDEDANGVLFTGNPASREDRHFVVNVQLGDESVVSPGVGVEPEKDLLVMDGDEVGRAVFIRPSSLTVPGQRVLSDSQLTQLGDVLAPVEAPFLSHFDLSAYPATDVLVDFEFKFQDGQLVVKQARPFLISDPAPPGPVFSIEVPEGARVCGQFQHGRSTGEEAHLKSEIELRPGAIALPARGRYFSTRLIDSLRFGQEGRSLEPLNHGLFRLDQRTSCCPERSWYELHFDQDFDLDGAPFRLSLEWTFGLPGSVPGDFSIRLDDRLLSESSYSLLGVPLGPDAPSFVVEYRSCSYAVLPLWEISVEFQGGDWARFHQRYGVGGITKTRLASVVRGEAFLDGRDLAEESYWRLVYAAERHNTEEKFSMIFDPPITVGETSGVAALCVEELPRAALLDSEFQVLRELEVDTFDLEVVENPPFQRGDPNGDGRADISDAVFVLAYLFTGGPAPTCMKSADTNDSGELDLSDPVFLLNHLFLGGGDPGDPFGACGIDPTADELACESYGLCFTR